MSNPTVTNIGELMDALKGDTTRQVSLRIKPTGDSLVKRIREGRTDQPVRHPPELDSFDALMARINKHYGERLTDSVLLQAVGTVRLHKGCLIGAVRRMTIAEFNEALDDAKGQHTESKDEPPADKPASTPDTSQASLDARALAIFIEDTSRKKKNIAKILGLKNTQSLAPARCPKLAAAMRAYHAPDPDQIRGSKNADGNLEAWKEEEDE